jgi:hypothetical protein
VFALFVALGRAVLKALFGETWGLGRADLKNTTSSKKVSTRDCDFFTKGSNVKESPQKGQSNPHSSHNPFLRGATHVVVSPIAENKDFDSGRQVKVSPHHLGEEERDRGLRSLSLSSFLGEKFIHHKVNPTTQHSKAKQRC